MLRFLGFSSVIDDAIEELDTSVNENAKSKNSCLKEENCDFKAIFGYTVRLGLRDTLINPNISGHLMLLNNLLN